ncbi:hypothetical protein CHS0354_002079 [Potamilus streckersoni]|uniref:oxaloacetate tautomerase n=1 Tax=Potamilus streckersoni TaxID=2493646 RepID=A0AAE0T614_9BIVA|nr:hypothetical protein CHS0354_002079 [Potamilus streckersoni]
MTDYIFAPRPNSHIPIVGSDKVFPVHRIYCVGRNYADHVVEMGFDPDRDPPVFFQKNPDCAIINNGDFAYPEQSSDVHHEIELVIALGKGGRNIAPENSEACIFGFAVGLDMTLRDLQALCKDNKQPWEIAKAFDRSMPCSAIKPTAQSGIPHTGSIRLAVNGNIRQQGNLNQMIWKIPEIISYLSRYFELVPGDLIMTGTPAGVGAVKRGDVLTGSVEGIGELTARVV